MATDPHETGDISVTIKGDEPGGKFNDPKSPSSWIVFHGTPAKVREQICEVFDLADDDERPLYDLINEATDIFKASAKVSRDLGGRVIAQGQQSSGDVWAQAQKDAPEPEKTDPILDALEACTTVTEVQQVWAENQDAFNSSAAYMDAYRTRGKALASAGA